MRIFLPNALTDSDLDEVVAVVRRANLRVHGAAFVTQQNQATASIILVADNDTALALDALTRANIGASIKPS